MILESKSHSLDFQQYHTYSSIASVCEVGVPYNIFPITATFRFFLFQIQGENNVGYDAALPSSHPPNTHPYTLPKTDGLPFWICPHEVRTL